MDWLDSLLAVLIDIGWKLLWAIVLLIVGRILIKLVMKWMRSGKFGKKLDETVAHFLINAVNVVLNVVLFVSVIAILGVPMASVITVIASAGVAIGLALQGSLSNLAGGIMILIFRPFRVGHFIEAGGFSGTVKDIDLFYTVLNTPDNKVVTIPNGTVMGEEIINYSVNDTRRVDLVFNVAYGTDVDKVKAILLEEGTRHELVLPDPAAFCRMTKQNESSIDFTLRLWVNSGDYWQVNFDVMEAVHKRFAAEGIEIPFNQLDVHVKQD